MYITERKREENNRDLIKSNIKAVPQGERCIVTSHASACSSGGPGNSVLSAPRWSDTSCAHTPTRRRSHTRHIKSSQVSTPLLKGTRGAAPYTELFGAGSATLTVELINRRDRERESGHTEPESLKWHQEFLFFWAQCCSFYNLFFI